MQTKRVLILLGLAALAAVVFVLNYIAGLYYLFWVYWWYDIMMHFITGAAVGGFAAWSTLRVRPTISASSLFWIVFGAIMVVGIGWEIFEYMNGMYVGETRIVFDTVCDLILDTLGAFLATTLVRYALRDTTHTA
ncbi:MAG: hypothetical protein KBD16_00125 [Candidatus Pacebacteria bacterium]|nr:hypothetical protein [Candidatus Paceibacterota bacterium]